MKPRFPDIAMLPIILALPAAPAAQAQDFRNTRIMNHVVTGTVMGNVCDDARRKQERLPDACITKSEPCPQDDSAKQLRRRRTT